MKKKKKRKKKENKTKPPQRRRTAMATKYPSRYLVGCVYLPASPALLVPPRHLSSQHQPDSPEPFWALFLVYYSQQKVSQDGIVSCPGLPIAAGRMCAPVVQGAGWCQAPWRLGSRTCPFHHVTLHARSRDGHVHAGIAPYPHDGGPLGPPPLQRGIVGQDLPSLGSRRSCGSICGEWRLRPSRSLGAWVASPYSRSGLLCSGQASPGRNAPSSPFHGDGIIGAGAQVPRRGSTTALLAILGSTRFRRSDSSETPVRRLRSSRRNRFQRDLSRSQRLSVPRTCLCCKSLSRKAGEVARASHGPRLSPGPPPLQSTGCPAHTGCPEHWLSSAQRTAVRSQRLCYPLPLCIVLADVPCRVAHEGKAYPPCASVTPPYFNGLHCT